jgi:hypothetical protein
VIYNSRTRGESLGLTAGIAARLKGDGCGAVCDAAHVVRWKSSRGNFSNMALDNKCILQNWQ